MYFTWVGTVDQHTSLKDHHRLTSWLVIFVTDSLSGTTERWHFVRLRVQWIYHVCSHCKLWLSMGDIDLPPVGVSKSMDLDFERVSSICVLTGVWSTPVDQDPPHSLKWEPSHTEGWTICVHKSKLHLIIIIIPCVTCFLLHIFCFVCV